uniref:InlB B-repeat-containing protein n=1 Tax=Hominenteromicrobium sp. TaxID=3073581 RepID=UPI003A90B0DA
MKKKIIAVLLSACMLVSACPTGAFAMSDEETNTYTATGDVMQGGTPVVDETSAPEATEVPEQTPTPAPEETPTPAPEETPAPVEVEAQATPAAGAEETAPAKQSEEAGISTAMLLPDDDKKPAVDTYCFYDADGKELTEWQQTVAEGEELLEPTAPTKENARFVGWYVDGETLLRFGAVESVSGTNVTVRAKFEEYSYVYFMDEDGNNVVYHTAAGKAGETVSEDILNAATAKLELTMSKDKGVVGWRDEEGNTLETITFVAGDRYVYPVVKTGFWVTFDTDGGDYVAPQFRMEALELSGVTPNRSGYTFDGWYDAKNNQVTTVSETATVTAHWTASNKTEYTVIHWQENADDNGYTLVKDDTQTKNGTTGAQTNAEAKNYEGFTAQAITQKTIAGDGSTIVNVYYKRDVYSVKFMGYGDSYICGKEEHKHNWDCGYGWKCDKEEHKHNDNCKYGELTDKTITAKWGANISAQWPKQPQSTWYVSQDIYSSKMQAGIDVMPLGGATFYQYRPSDDAWTQTGNYYVEVVPGETGTANVDGTSYKLDHKDTTDYYGWLRVTKEDQYAITGFTFNEKISASVGDYYDGAKFYYTRDSYDITFINGGKTEKTESRKYQQNISDVTYTPPTRPTGVPANFTFAGWYENELCKGDPFVFTGKTMPAKGITLYAKWQAPVIEAKVYLTASADGEFETIEIPYGKKLSDSKEFKALLEKFKEEQPSAWIDSNGALFNVDTELYSSVTISPFFPSAKDGFTVTYVEGTNVKTDNQKYVSGSSARVLPPENSENFRAWKMEGKLIYPGDKITVTKNTTLTAVYTNKPQTVTITYHYNFEGSSTQPFIDSGYPKNTTATVKSLSEVKFTAPTGYKFLGWATTPDSNTVTYKVGATVFVDANDDNNLYAVWQEETYKVTYELKDVGKSDWETVQTAKVNAVTGNKTTQPNNTYETKYVDGVKYEFDGWYLDESLETPVTFPYTVTSDVTFYAAYKEAEKYELKYDLAEGSWAASETDKELTYK